MRTTAFGPGGYYHIYNRGVDRRTIFMDGADYRRFQNAMIRCNDRESPSPFRWRNTFPPKPSPNPLVRIVSYCLMPNHYHMVLTQCVSGGVSLFLQRLANSYTKYFDRRYGRTGRLFESPFKSKETQTEEYLLHLTRYIHLNPLELFDPDWKTNRCRDWISADAFLRCYPWSSYGSYLNKQGKIPIERSSIEDLLSKRTDYQTFMKSWATKDLVLFDLYSF